MKRYVVRRALQSIILLIAVSIIGFMVMHVTPGGPIQFMENPRVSPQQIRDLETRLGLHDPLPVQYLRWVGGIVKLDFGRSYVSRRPVLDLIKERIPATLLLSGTELILGLLIGIPLGIQAALKRGRPFDTSVRFATVALNSIPHWWLALVLITFLAVQFPILPSGGMYTLGRDNLLDRLWHLVLPALLGAISIWLTLTQFLRNEVLEVLNQDYIRTARAKGLPWGIILNRHILRNALIPIVTMMGGTLAGLIAGSVFMETVFSWPGMGRLAIDAFYKRDYPLLMALFMIGSFLVILGNLLADIAYSYVDPRVKLE